MAWSKTQNLTVGEILKRFIFITIGAVLMAVALEIFLVPNEIIDGGITGISIVLSSITPIKLGVFLFIINLPFLFIGYKQIGKTFAFSTLYGIVVLSVATTFLHHVDPFTNEKILAVLFGGLILGLGVGLVIRYGGALDGTEIIAILLSKGAHAGRADHHDYQRVYFITAGFVFGADSAMYSIFILHSGKSDGYCGRGLDESKSVTIISNEYEEISSAIIDVWARRR